MAWSVLSVDLPDVPRLLVKYHFDTSGYQVKLTDLSRIWTDSLSKEDIIQRASDVGSSIDPSQDDEQFRILLTKIESALKCEDGTSLSLTRDENDGSSLRLDLSAPLPHPLPPLRWKLRLSQQPQEDIESELVTPLVLRSSNLERQIRQLVDELHDKDRVISKICDRLETSGNDLTTVFPGVSNVKTSRKKSQREQLAKHVKGLQDFDEANFRQRIPLTDMIGEAATKVVNEVFQDLPSSLVVAQRFGDWWEQLSKGSQVNIDKPSRHDDIDGHQQRTGLSKDLVDSQQDDSSFQDDDFQRQGTPPHLKAASLTKHSAHGFVESKEVVSNGVEARSHTNNTLDDESTADEEDDLDTTTRMVTLKNSKATSASNRVSPSPKKLGAIGGKPSSPVAEHTAGVEASSQRPHSKLGAIGGKSKVPTTMAKDKGETSPPQIPPSSKTSKMGAIGGQRGSMSTSPSPAAQRAKSSEPAKEVTPIRTTPQAKEKTPPPQEDPEDRADKKRDQLKRELEEKAKAPVKKKRKF